MRYKLIIFITSLATTACGVRGRPQPPLTPPEIGRGQPSYKKAAEELNLPTEERPPEDAKPAATESTQ